jgi:hypothetical protein
MRQDQASLGFERVQELDGLAVTDMVETVLLQVCDV